ncbi:putative guanine nucleotide exchange factor MCF2L2 [Galemys pyrenaicus]|uniref:Putative guanine nucleotide exchange factor MCF2L2 n=1 Tax=Galemys pyrenaicus TaxID=202257 RepID=A0A8J6DPN0_GALPY|nr:putative guanine nucleotide exchange factor MCF2L2 [Galemys pyrenaicus]
MQQEVRPLGAVDIIEQLHRQFAILSGGRGKDGAPIITFPEFVGFKHIQEEDFLNVMTYLTSIPSEPGVPQGLWECSSEPMCLTWCLTLATLFCSVEAASIGFIIVIDRRRDKWSSIKASLTRIAVAFPGNLQLIFILRPSRFLQRTFTDIGIKYYRDEFKMKVPIVMLNSVSDLHGYIDKSQLTEDLGGTLDYRHSQWINHRTALENFALTLKTTAQMLQMFGACLATTELPRGVPSTEGLLTSHTRQWDKLQDELKLLEKQGATLLSCIQEPMTKYPTSKLNPNELENVITMERLLVQLNETEKAFSQFWSEHHLKLNQCLQLQHFEHNFCEVKLALDNLLAEQAEFTDIGDCVMHVEQLLKEHKTLEEKGQEPLKRAQLLALIGDQLIQSHHYAADSIRPRCVELRHLCDDFINENKKKDDILAKSLELHRQLDKVSQWCEAGIYLLASQAVDKCQSREGVDTALNDIETFLGTAKDYQLPNPRGFYNQFELMLTAEVKVMFLGYFNSLIGSEMWEDFAYCLKKSRRIIRDLIETEEIYIKEIKSIIDGYITPMDFIWLKHLIPDVLQNNKDFLFGNIRELYEFHNRYNSTLLRKMESRRGTEIRLMEFGGYKCLKVSKLKQVVQNQWIGLNWDGDEKEGRSTTGSLKKKTFLKELEKCTENPELLARCFLKREGKADDPSALSFQNVSISSLSQQPFFSFSSLFCLLIPLNMELNFEILLWPIDLSGKIESHKEGARDSPPEQPGLCVESSSSGIGSPQEAAKLTPPAWGTLSNWLGAPFLYGMSVDVCLPFKKEDLQIYFKYHKNLPRARAIWQECQDCAYFGVCQRQLDHNSPLFKYLREPSQRLIKYQTLLKELGLGEERGTGSKVGKKDVVTLLAAEPYKKYGASPFRERTHQQSTYGPDCSLSLRDGLPFDIQQDIWFLQNGPKRTKDLAFSAELQQALAMLEDLIKSCELAVDLAAVSGCPDDISGLGKLLLCDSFNIWTVNKDRYKMKDFIRFKPSQRQIYLFEREIVFCKTRMETGDQGLTPHHSFKKSMKLMTLSIRQLGRGSSKKFEIANHNGLEKYILQVKLKPSPQVSSTLSLLHFHSLKYLIQKAASKEIRDCWFSTISKLLLEKQNNIKGRISPATFILESYTDSHFVVGVQIEDIVKENGLPRK